MAEEATKTGEQSERDAHGPRDKSPTTDVPKPTQRAEISNYEIVSHHFARRVPE